MHATPSRRPDPVPSPARKSCPARTVVLLLALCLLPGSGAAQGWPDASLTLWLDAAAGVTADGDGRVSEWQDLSTGGHHLSQTDAGRRPRQIPSALNGRPVLEFREQWLSRPAVPGSELFSATATTIVVVQRQLGSDPYTTTLSWVAPEDHRWMMHATHADNLALQVGRPGAGGSAGVTQPPGWDDAWHVVTMRRDGDDALIRVDGVAVGQGLKFTSAGDPTRTANLILANDPWGNTFNGEIAEVLTFSTALSDGEIRALESELFDRWGLPGVPTAVPDLLVRADSDPAGEYAGDDVFQVEPADPQVREAVVGVGAVGTFRVKVVNDGRQAGTVNLRASEGVASGWTVAYRAGDREMTSSIVTPGGWTSPELAAGAALEVEVEIRHSGVVPPGSRKPVRISVHDTFLPALVRDVVQVDAVAAAGVRADLSVLREGDAVPAGEGVYNADGTRQTRWADVVSGGASRFTVTLSNDGNIPAAFRLAGAGDGAGWTVRHEVSQALRFDGVDDYVDLGAWAPGRQWSIETRVRPDALPGGRRTIAGAAAECRDWGVLLLDGRFAVGIQPPGGCWASYSAPTPAVAGAWYDVAAVCDGAEVVLYVDGVEAARGPVADYAPTAAGVRIAGEYCCSAYFPGAVGDVRIWSRALTPVEVDIHRILPPEPGAGALDGWWRLDDGVAGMARDLSPNRRHGLLVNGPAWEFVDVSAAVAGAGWTDNLLPGGGTLELRVTATPGGAAVAGTPRDLALRASPEGLVGGADTVRMVPTLRAPGVAALDVLYTTTADFGAGQGSGVDEWAVPDRLVLSEGGRALPYLWVPNSNDSSVSKIDIRTGRELGRYRVAPAGIIGSPSRTTVDLLGNCWVANRQSATVVKIGLLESGGFVDRNGDGIVQTSRDLDGDGSITGAEVLDWGADECVIHEVLLVPGQEARHTPGTYLGAYANNYWDPGPRGLAVDARGDVWAGTHDTRRYYLIDGTTGEIRRQVDTAAVNHTAYGAAIDARGILWSSGYRESGPQTLLRLDTATGEATAIPLDFNPYGLALDRDGNLFVSAYQQSILTRWNTVTGTRDWSVPIDPNGRGVAVSDDGDVWVVSTAARVVGRYSNHGVRKATIPVGAGPTGVAVDAAGRIWVMGDGDEYLRRIDPATDSIDLVKRVAGNHYGYSDMTGILARNATLRLGTWRRVHDSFVADAAWDRVTWHAEDPTGTNVVVRVRSSNDGIRWSAWERPANGAPVAATPPGRYLEFEVQLVRPDGAAAPALLDLAATGRAPAVADLAVTLSATPNPVASEYPQEVRVGVANPGDSWASAVEVTVLMPSEVDVFTVTVPGGFHRRSGNEFVCTLPGVAPGSTAGIVFSTAPLRPGTFRVEAVATFPGDPDPSDNAAGLDLVSLPVPCAVPPAGVVAWWSGADHLIDLAGTHELTAQGGPTFGEGKVGRGFVFDSNDDRLSTPHDPELDLLRPGFTVQFWMLGTADQPGQSDGLVTLAEKSHGWTDNTGWAFQAYPASGVVTFGAGYGGGTGNGFVGVNSRVRVLDGRWHHVAGVWDGYDLRLYVDGALHGVTPLLIPAVNNRPVNLGHTWGGGSPRRFFRGALDEVILHGRALSDAEIAGVFDARSGGVCSEALAVLGPAELEPARLGSEYGVSLMAAFGQPPYTWSTASGTLPDGVALTPSGRLEGVPVEAGSFAFTSRVRDAAGAVVLRPYVLTVEACAPRLPDLVGYWSADGHAEDSAGAAHGVLERNATHAAGRSGRAFVLDGVEDAVRLPGSTSGPLDITGNQLSLVAWVNAAATHPPAHGYQLIIDKYWDGSATGYDLSLNVGRLEWHVATVDNPTFLLAVDDFPLRRWVHVAATYDGAVARIFLDGVEAASAPLTGNIRHNGHDAAIGNDNWPGSAGYAFNGLLDEIQIYRRGLSDIEVLTLMAAGAAGDCEPDWSDLALKSALEPDAAYSGSGLFQQVPDGRQTRALTTDPLVPAAYDVRVANVSPEARSFTLRVDEGAVADWGLAYRVGGEDVSNPMRSAAGYTTPVLAPGAGLMVRVEVTPGASVPAGTIRTVLLRVNRDPSAPLVRDMVRMETTCGVAIQPDLMVRRSADNEFAGEGFWNADASGQSRLQEVEAGGVASFEVVLRNQGNVADRFRLRAAGPGSGWSATYLAGRPHLRLDGSGQHVTVPDHPALRPANVTVEGWFSFSVVGGTRVMVSKARGGGVEDSYVLWHDGSRLRGGASGVGEVLHPWVPTLGRWYHLAYVFDADADRQALVVDGVEVVSGAAVGDLVYDDRPLRIGADTENGVPQFFFGGRVSGVRVWNAARSVAQLQAAAASRLTGTEPGLAACWRMEDGDGEVVDDAGPDGLVGTVSGVGFWGVSGSTPADGLDVTGLLSGGGAWEVTLQPKEMLPVAVQVTAGAGILPGAVAEVRVTADSLSDPAAVDVVRLDVESAAAGGTPGPVTYTSDRDFERGRLSGVDYGVVSDELRLSGQSAALRFLWVPNNEGSISKLDTLTGREVARYRTVPTGVNGQPSRTTVDLVGSCYVANRYAGTVVKVGLLEHGQYVDRNGDGLIQTSRDLDGDGDITADEMLPWGEDECVLWELSVIPGTEGPYVPGTFPGPYRNDWGNPGPRGVAVDADGNLWLGTMDTRRVYHVDGATGAILRDIDVASANSHRSYGAVLDRNGVFWAASNDRNHVLRLDPVTGEFRAIPLGHFSYGINVDRQGHLFVSGWESGRLTRIDTGTGEIEWSVPADTQGRGIAITEDGDVWVAHSGPGTVVRRSNTGQLKAVIPAGNQPTGVAVDSRGMVWCVGLGDDLVRRIDPARNVVDLVKRVAAANASGFHYGYSDMTGSVARNSTTRIGFWNVVHNSGRNDTPWGAVDWDAETPEGTSVRVRVRSSNDRETWSLWEAADDALAFAATPPGRYLEVEVTFQSRQLDVSPALRSLTVLPATSVNDGVLVYSNAFDEEPGGEWSDGRVARTPVGDRGFLGEFGNETVTLTLDDLPPHAAVTVRARQFVLRSWDGNSTVEGPDRWILDLAGGLRLVETSYNNGPAETAAAGQAYPGRHPGGQNPARTGAVESNTLGYEVPGEGPMDAVYFHRHTFPHTASRLVLNFRAEGLSSDPDDETWGLDDIQVFITPLVVRPVLEVVGIDAEGLALRVTVEPGATYDVEWSSDLIRWELLVRETPVATPLELVDPDVFTEPHRFYRVIRKP